MSCDCINYPNHIYRHDLPESFISKLEEKEVSLEQWKSLYECKICGQLWVIDVWEKYNPGIALKIKNPNGWDNLDVIPFEKELLLKSRGGTTDEKCIMKNCSNHRVNGVVYCLDHLYETGARK